MMKKVSFFLLMTLIVAVGAFSFLPSLEKRSELIQKKKNLQEQIDHTEKEIQHLRKREVDFHNDSFYLEKLARDKMGYTKPDEIIYKFDEQSEPE